MDELRNCTVTLLLASACQGGIVPTDGTTDAETESSSGDATTSSTGDVPDSTSIDAETSSSSSSGSSDESGEPPLPLPTSRLVLDVATPGGHALMLRELADGEPQPAVALTGDVPATATITTMPLGASDRIAFDVEFDDSSHDIFLVDWTMGHPAVVTQLDAGVPGGDSIGAMAWVEELGVIVVRIGYSFYRIDVVDDGPSEPIDLLDDVPFGDALDERTTARARGTRSRPTGRSSPTSSMPISRSK